MSETKAIKAINQLVPATPESVETEVSSIPEIGPESIKSPREEGETQKSVEEIIAFRKEQSTGSRLLERITGLRPDSPHIVERLLEDQKIIRSKYGLPLVPRIENPDEYESFLRNSANKIGVTIRSTSDCGSLFSEYPAAAGVYLDTHKKIAIDINKESRGTHTKGVKELEHEVVHALQDRLFPSMPIELMEYEAYVAGVSPDWLKGDEKYSPGVRIKVFFDVLVGGSLMYHYKKLSAEVGKEVLPEWNNARFFLEKVDHINESELAGL